MKRKVPRACAILVCLLLLPRPALAWNSTGHRVVAQIAWSRMSEKARAVAVALLRKAPADADLSNAFSTNPAVDEATRRRRFLLYASTWPDVVRDRDHKARRDKYHKATWHYADFFWKQPNPNQPPQDLDGPPNPNAFERLTRFHSDITSNPGQFEDRKATELAWMLHLVGDIHQPLHCSARVTPSEPDGDEGGNLFCLDNHDKCFNLHSYWDNIFDNADPRKASESFDAYVARLADDIMVKHPLTPALAQQLRPLDFAAWTREGFGKAKLKVYTGDLDRFESPSEDYRDAALLVAQESAALAGYRLADTLNRMFN